MGYYGEGKADFCIVSGQAVIRIADLMVVALASCGRLGGSGYVKTWRVADVGGWRALTRLMHLGGRHRIVKHGRG
jgi:hypothetical protein